MLFPTLQSLPNHLHHGRKNRNNNNCKQQQFQVSLHKRQVAEEISRKAENPHPESRPRYIVQHKIKIVHLSHTRHKRGESTDDRDEPGQNNSLAAVLLEKFMSLVEVTLLEYFRIRVVEQSLSEKMPYHVIARIAQNRCGKNNQRQIAYPQRHVGQGSDSAGHEKKRIAGQERRYNKPRFTENDYEQNSIRPQMIILHKFYHVLVDMQDEIGYKLENIHKSQNEKINVFYPFAEPLAENDTKIAQTTIFPNHFPPSL